MSSDFGFQQLVELCQGAHREIQRRIQPTPSGELAMLLPREGSFWQTEETKAAPLTLSPCFT